LNNLIVILCMLLSGGAVAADTRAPAACFPSGEAFMAGKYGAAYRNDENLRLKKERYGKQVYFAARDLTSGTNHPVTLLMQRPGRGWCEVLATPPVATLRATRLDGEGRPLAFLAIDQGTTSHEISYAWDKANARFKPAQCLQVMWIEQRAVRTPVACEGIASP
jgi:hypothetical protein